MNQVTKGVKSTVGEVVYIINNENVGKNTYQNNGENSTSGDGTQNSGEGSVEISRSEM